MKKLKKFAAVALTGAMALSMAACGSDNKSTTEGATSDTKDTTASSSATSEATTEGGGSTAKTPRHEATPPEPFVSVHGMTFIMTVHTRTSMMIRRYPMRNWLRRCLTL